VERVALLDGVDHEVVRQGVEELLLLGDQRPLELAFRQRLEGVLARLALEPRTRRGRDPRSAMRPTSTPPQRPQRLDHRRGLVRRSPGAAPAQGLVLAHEPVERRLFVQGLADELRELLALAHDVAVLRSAIRWATCSLTKSTLRGARRPPASFRLGRVEAQHAGDVGGDDLALVGDAPDQLLRGPGRAARAARPSDRASATGG
jgi:hypothetical protein